jgi:hypothetical protein
MTLFQPAVFLNLATLSQVTSPRRNPEPPPNLAMARPLLLLVLLALLAARDGRTDESLRLYAEAAHDNPLASAQASLRLEASFQAPSASRHFAGRGAPWGRRVVAASVGG